ncbi:MAG: peptidoglycan DD-metalloendopeptidase family protein [Proteobacteria bacterium]|nr:peptidoglycan DD-metalloendopeptidase family protein [Pseudomonadota bacterium]
MQGVNKLRGATAIRSKERLPRKRLLALGVIAACILVAFSLQPTDTETDQQTRLELPDGSAQAVKPEKTAAPEPVAAVATPSPPPWNEVSVKSGDNLSLIFKRAGYSDRDIYLITEKAPDGKSLARIFPGQTIAFSADESGELDAVRHIISPLETVTYQNTEAGFERQRDIRTPEVKQARASAIITSSLFLAGQEAGLSQNMIMELANIFGGVIDFALDPRVGDTIHLLYEDLYLDGKKYRDGEIIAASFTNQGKTFSAYRYKNSQGDNGYYSEDGVSMRKAFLLAPVDFTRISSNFNPRRLHPIYKTRRPHRGTDYVAPRGTPVFSTGEGRVIKAGYSKANGNYVFVQHGEKYVTKYLHLHKRSVRAGQRIAQSQVVGTVGSTGAATGVHLHYEFLMDGVHRNPRTIHKKLPKAKSLNSAEMPLFRQATSGAFSQLASLQTESHLAMNSSGSTSAQVAQ